MKLSLLSAVLLPVAMLAQQPQPASSPSGEPAKVNRVPSTQTPYTMGKVQLLPENYEVSLSMAEKDGKPIELSFVVASPQFNVSPGLPSLRFSGDLEFEESGKVVIAYQLGWEIPVEVGGRSTQFKPASIQGSVRLKLGEEVEIMRAESRTVRLSIKKVEAKNSK